MVPSIRCLRETAARVAVSLFFAFTLSSCRDSVLAPETPLSASIVMPAAAPEGIRFPRMPVPDADARVPVIDDIRIQRQGSDLVVRVIYERRDPRIDLQYDAYMPGGWCFQMFLNTDRQETGYWRGYDFVTRDGEPGLLRRALRVRRTDSISEDAAAGGWGPEVATVPIRVTKSTFTFRVPMQSVGNTDGVVDYCMELYLTDACPDCDDGSTHVYAYDVFGSSDERNMVAYRAPASELSRFGHFARQQPTTSAR